MSPFVKSGDFVLVQRKHSYRKHDVVVAQLPKHEAIKRVKSIDKDAVWLEGDNSDDSFDSRAYGFVQKDAILGVVMARFTLPVATAPPSFHWRDLRWLPVGVAAIFSVLAVTQLATFEEFVAALEAGLLVNSTVATILAIKLAALEILAIPFLLSFWLSPLMRTISVAAMLFAPLLWILVLILSRPGLDSGVFGGILEVSFGASIVLMITISLLTMIVLAGFSIKQPQKVRVAKKGGL